MLANYLKGLRQARIVSSQAALSNLASGWSVDESGALTREFSFDDHRQASNFMQRYADYCQKVNMTPEWSNVYNRVNVRLACAEFDGSVTSKEVKAAAYLDTVGQVRLSDEVDEDLSFARITHVAQLDRETLQNVQDKPTSLLEGEARDEQRPQLYLTQ